MMQNKIHLALSLGEDREVFDYPKKPVSEELINICESRLGLPLPYSYKYFLSEYGFTGFNGRDIFGLLSDGIESNSFRNAYAFTVDERDSSNLPNFYFAIENMDGDSVVCLDLSQMRDGECPVILWDHSESVKKQILNPYLISDSFGDYLLEGIQKYVKEEG